MTSSLNLNQIQKKVEDWIQTHGGYWPPLSMLASITEEVGELAREINHLEGYKPKKPQKGKGLIGEELADILFSIVCVANHYQIDLDEKFKNVLEKYKKRDSERFNKK